jgi:hypothetical protein
METRYDALRLAALALIVIAISGGILLGHPESVFSQESKPVAFIDGTLKVKLGDTVYLDGTLSSDPAGGSLLYLWTFEETPEGSFCVITDRASAHAQFHPDKPGKYKVRLVVNNGLTTSEPVYRTVVVLDSP